MRSLNSSRYRIQIKLPHWLPCMCRSQDIMQMLAQLAGTHHDAGARAAVKTQGPRGVGGFDEASQLHEPDQVAVCRQILNWRLEGPLIQRIHEIEGGVASAPLERVGAIAHRLSCLMSALSIP